MAKMLSILVIILLIVAPVCLWWLAQTPLPPMEGAVTVAGLTEPVVVRFDARGVPYVEARSDADLYMAQGYLTARDRMFQMDIARRTASGRLSQVFGLPLLSFDKLMRTIGLYRRVEIELAGLPAEMRACLEAYARGVNLYIDGHRQRLPLEFRALGYEPEPWQPQDSLAILKHQAYIVDESWKLDDLRQRVFDKAGQNVYERLFDEGLGAAPLARHSLPSGKSGTQAIALAQVAKASDWLCLSRPNTGSNTIALEGRRSDTGGALLACDRHTAFSSPDPWYLCTLVSPAVHISGASIPGVPGIFLGRNSDIAWGASALKADVQDLFVEEFSPSLPNQYKTTAGWSTADEITENIPVRFGKDVVHKVTATVHGPVLLRSGNTAAALAWTGLKSEKSDFQALWKLNRAQSWQDFRLALADYTGSPQVFAFADRAGSTGYQAAGSIPVRAAGGQGTMLSPGWQPAGQWVASVPFDDLPSALRSPRGTIVAANQKILSGKTLIGHQWCASYRALRAIDLIGQFQSGGRRIGLPDLNEIQSDQWSQLSLSTRKEIHEAGARTELIDRIQLASIDLLDHWDGSLRPDSAASTIHEAFLRTLARRLVEAKIGPELGREYLERWPLWPLLVETYLRDKPADWLPSEERTHPVFVITTLAQALKEVRLLFRNDDPAKWPWQGAHPLTFKHAASRVFPWLGPLIDIGPVGAGGDGDTLNSCDVASDAGTLAFPSLSGPTLRMIVDMADRDKLYASTSLGQSGQFFSPHRRDQLRSWLRVDPMPVAFSQAQADKQTQHKLLLTNRMEP